MANEFQQKLDRYAARYADGGVPMDSRHVLELATDLHDLMTVLTGRVAMLEYKPDQLNQKLGDV